MRIEGIIWLRAVVDKLAYKHNVDTFEVEEALSNSDMARSKRESPPAGSVDELVELFDTHDMGAYWDEMPEVDFEVDIEHRTHLVAVDDDLVDKIAEVARTKHVSSESLVNALLREKLAEAI